MRKEWPVLFLFLVLMTSACGAQASGATGTPVLTETRAPTAVATETLFFTETPSPRAVITATPITPIPTNLSDCINSASFIDDVTIPDNSSIQSNTPFTKTWRIKNTGTCIWGPEYVLAPYAGERMYAADITPLSVTFPGQTLDLSLLLIAPNINGTHKGYFVIKNPAGLIMRIDSDSRLWVVVDVPLAVAADPTPTPGVGGNIPVTGAEEAGFVEATCNYTNDTIKVSDVISAINVYRSQNGLPAYTVNELLTVAATAHANDIACNKIFNHSGSDGSTPNTRVAKSGYLAAFVTENVYGSYPPLSGQGVFDWWKNDRTDPRHSQNLLSSVYTEIGVAYSYYNNFGYYVLLFAKPQ